MCVLVLFFLCFGCSNCVSLHVAYFIVQQNLGRALWVGGSIGGFVDDSWLGVEVGGSVGRFVRG